VGRGSHNLGIPFQLEHKKKWYLKQQSLRIRNEINRQQYLVKWSSFQCTIYELVLQWELLPLPFSYFNGEISIFAGCFPHVGFVSE